jgi:hypothetical protein
MPDGIQINHVNGSTSTPPIANKPPAARRRTKKPAAPVSLQQLLDDLRTAGATLSQTDQARADAEGTEAEQEAKAAYEAADTRYAGLLAQIEAAPVHTVSDIVLKLEHAIELECPSYIRHLHQQVAAMTETDAAKVATKTQPCPAAFVEQAIAAVLPMIDPDDREQLSADFGDAEVYAALKPIFADYTVEDAVAASFALGAMLKKNRAPRYQPDRFEAGCQARDMLQDFICKARPSSPACAAARMSFLQQEADNTIAERNMPLLYAAIAEDIERLRRNDFTAPDRKRRFGGCKWYEV